MDGHAGVVLHHLLQLLERRGAALDPGGEAAGGVAREEIRAAEDENRPLSPDAECYAAFRALANEIVSRLPMFCRAKSRTSADVTEAAK